MQLINVITFSPLTAVPAVGDVLTSGAASGTVLVVDMTVVSVAMNTTVNFAVGDVLPIGTVSDVFVQEVMNYIDTIISQYANSDVMINLIQPLIDAINPYANINAFYNDVWNILTAKGHGLDIWGRIVNISRILQVPSTGGTFGFEEALPGAHSFNSAPFYSGAAATSGHVLTDEAYRLLILTKAAANIARTSIPELNALLLKLFPGRGNVYVQSNGNMSMTILLSFTLQPFELSILKNSNVFPIPTGVQVNILQYANTLMFAEAGIGANYPTFGYGSFFGGFL